jgi:hypothetical protein
MESRWGKGGGVAEAKASTPRPSRNKRGLGWPRLLRQPGYARGIANRGLQEAPVARTGIARQALLLHTAPVVSSG